MINSQHNKYLENTVRTATPAQLLIMLVDGAIRFCKLGIEGIKQRNFEQAHVNFIKVQDIINEFIITLDTTFPIADRLMQLYDYFKLRITEANIKKSVEPAEEILGYLIELRETWVQAAIMANKKPVGVDHG